MSEATTHELTHVLLHDSLGTRLTPACICGWYSPRCEHADFERHRALHQATMEETP